MLSSVRGTVFLVIAEAVITIFNNNIGHFVLASTRIHSSVTVALVPNRFASVATPKFSVNFKFASKYTTVNMATSKWTYNLIEFLQGYSVA